jgi:hypothetical protein
VPAQLHLAENTLALHLLLERLEGLIDIVVADENLHALFLLLWSCVVLDDPGMCRSPPICRQSAIARALDLARL